MAKKKEVIEETKADKVEEVKEEVEQSVENDYEEISLEERIINIEKRAKASFGLNIVILILVIISLVFSIGGGATKSEDTEGTYSDGSETVAYDTSMFKKIAPSDIKKLSDGEAIVVWVGRQSCGYCAQYAPYMEEAMKEYGITAHYIDLATMINFNVEQPYITDSEEFDTLSSISCEGEWEKFAYDNVGGTPLTLIVKNNKVIGGLSGYTETDGITAAFKEAGLKKK